tara:strand:- start:1908 stop:2126 length:219 start_codon:yes stop_codon:yes gene_type:complete
MPKMNLKIKNNHILLLLTVFFLPNIYAYLGPGMTGGFLATVIGIFGSIFLLIFSIIYFPIKRRLNKNKKNRS